MFKKFIGKYKHIFLVIGLILIVISIFLFANYNKQQSQTLSSSSPKCPENYTTDEERNTEYKSFITGFASSSPQGTVADLAQARIDFLTKNNCVQTLKYIQDNGGIEGYIKTTMNDLMASDTPVTSTQTTVNTNTASTTEPYYPDNFFSFKYEQEAFTALRNQSLAELNVTNPIRYCGDYFYNEYGYSGDQSNFKPSAVEVFDCKEFGTGNSIVKRIAHSNQEGKGSDGQTFNLKTENTYSLGKYSITERDIGDSFYNASSSCEIKITDGSKEIYHLVSSKYSCSAYGSIEHDGKVLLVFQEPSSGGNAYAGENYFLLYDGSTLYDLGSFIMGGDDSSNFWTENGNFIFWGYDGRYEGAFRGSHNASTYAFIPRIFQIGAKDGVAQIVEGPAISPSVKQIYQHQLDGIRSSFSGAKANIGSYDVTSLDPFIVYWAGMARYILSGQSLNNELSMISATQKLFFLESPVNVSDLYSDIKFGSKSGIEY